MNTICIKFVLFYVWFYLLSIMLLIFNHVVRILVVCYFLFLSCIQWCVDKCLNWISKKKKQKNPKPKTKPKQKIPNGSICQFPGCKHSESRKFQVTNMSSVTLKNSWKLHHEISWPSMSQLQLPLVTFHCINSPSAYQLYSWCEHVCCFYFCTIMATAPINILNKSLGEHVFITPG